MQRLYVNGEEIQLNLWDTAGQERFRSLTPSYTRNSDAIVIAVDATDPASDARASEWIAAIESCGSTKGVVVAVAATKTDLQNTKQNATKAKKVAEKKKFLYFETSSKTKNKSVYDMFDTISHAILAREAQTEQMMEVNLEDAVNPSITDAGCCGLIKQPQTS